MSAFAIDNLPAPVGTSQRARLYDPSGDTVTDLALTESSGLFSGTIDVTLATAGLYEYEVRQVASQSGAAFTASTTITVSRGLYRPFVEQRTSGIGALSGGGLTLRQGDSYEGELALAVARPTDADWPADLTGWTVTLYGRAKPDVSAALGTLTLETSVTVVDPDGDQDLSIDSLAAEDTEALAGKVNGWTFEIVAVSGSSTATLISGTLSIVPKVRS